MSDQRSKILMVPRGGAEGDPRGSRGHPGGNSGQRPPRGQPGIRLLD